MIQKTIRKKSLHDATVSDDLAYWRSRSPTERVAAVELRRRQQVGSTARLQRVVQIFDRPPR